MNLKGFTEQKTWWISPSPIIKDNITNRKSWWYHVPLYKTGWKRQFTSVIFFPKIYTPQLNDEKNLKITKPVGHSTKFFKIPEQYLQFPSHKRQRKTEKPSQIGAKKSWKLNMMGYCGPNHGTEKKISGKIKSSYSL